jgi:hypothetical protein
MIIIDNFIQDKALLTKISLDKNFWKEGFHWYNGWWNSAPKDTRQELIKYIWGDHCPLNENIMIQGFEHWVGTYEAGDDKVVENFDEKWHLKHHFDKDEDLWHKTGEIVTPYIGTVYYPDPEIDNIEGGELQIWQTKELNTGAPYELIKPKYNRLIIFDAGQLHAVREVTKGIRKAIAINLWTEAPIGTDEMLR